MIISQTPYRVSFAGGGTDLPAFYREEPGAVLSVTIKRHIYVTVHRRFASNWRVSYSRTETVDRAADLQHEIVREAIALVGLDEPLEITTIGDVPAGTGMGSSSTLTVGLLHALYAASGRIVDRLTLARDSCQIELDALNKPIGRQDQYAAAFGGMNYFRFKSDDSVDVEPVPVPPTVLRELEARTLLLYTGTRRSADAILKRQSEGTSDRRPILRQMRELADSMRHSLVADNGLDEFSRLLHEGWALKRSLGFGISVDSVDGWYEAARRAGAKGGKLLGAGGGGFLLLFADPDCHDRIRDALGRPQELPFQIDHGGSRVVFVGDSQ
jgi:D-glycero-alpha-D-manno-heptose-7-phosphate kinase